MTINKMRLDIARAYLLMAIMIPIVVLTIGFDQKAEQVFIISAIMILIDIIFVVWLTIENKG